MRYKKIVCPEWDPRDVEERHTDDEIEKGTQHDRQPFHNWDVRARAYHAGFERESD